MNPNPWSKETQDRWFYLFLASTGLGLVLLFSPWMYVLLFSATTAVVTWPLYARLLTLLGGRRGLAATSATLILILAVLGPITLVIYLFALEAVQVAQVGVEFVADGRLEQEVMEVVWRFGDPEVEALVRQYLPKDFDPLGAILGPLQRGLLAALNGLGSALPALVNTIVGRGLDALIYLFALVTLYMEGPALLEVLKRLSPMDDRYEERLFHVFREFANNMVIGSVVTAALQGVVATSGYLIFGVPRALFAGILTGVFSFMPVVGTALVWVPVSLWTLANLGWKPALGLVVWNLLITGSVDNVVKPMLLRGSSNLHPLLVFLAVFGGLAWMGLPGVLVGPVVVACFLALYTIYCEDYLGLPRPATVEDGGLLAWVKERWSRRAAPPPEDHSSPESS